MASLYHDALKVEHEAPTHKFHAILAYNQNSNTVYGGTFYQNGSQPYKTMQTAWYYYKFPYFLFGGLLLFMNIGMQQGNTEDFCTLYQQLIDGYVY